MVKRVALVDGDTVTLLGDNPDRSTDSRAFGPVNRERVRGRAVYRYWPVDRRGRLRR
jgi:signal peptidase I